MKPILNVELGTISLKLQVENLNLGLKEAASHFDVDIQSQVAPLLENLTAENMLRLRELLPGLRVTGHYLVLEDSKILDAR